MQQHVNIVSVRHGQIEDGPYWAKLLVLEDEIETTEGFHGQRTVEYSVDKDSAKKVSHDLKGLLPCDMVLECAVRMKQNQPTLVVLGVNKAS